MNKLDQIEKDYMKEDVPEFSVGDTVEVHVKITEGGKERVQIFRGNVIQRTGGGPGESFTVRRTVQGEGVERTFPLHSPKVEDVKRVRSGKVRRSKLFYLRKRQGKSAQIRQKIESEKKTPKPEEKEEAAEQPEQTEEQEQEGSDTAKQEDGAVEQTEEEKAESSGENDAGEDEQEEDVTAEDTEEVEEEREEQEEEKEEEQAETASG